ncbi:ATP-binding protein [Brevundimonas aurantiaca]|jgi:hypothetical protein|uniref:ATP-binding protein n=1 Tax=Brevundimonas aurantiaca TaxID=74316 RepID=UPI0016007F8E|nr:hypothetical protein [Pseudomonas sp. FW305-3-2-15-E-TSA4]
MAEPPPDALQSLIDDPNETLGAEYKAEVELATPLGRAKLARHLAALANHGGGYLIIGFNDELKPQEPRPALPTRDDVGRVVKRYLEPPLQCDVRTLRDAGQRTYGVIVVPAHGATPVCAAADGPQDAAGRVQGITRGVHYIRKPGPESAPLLTSQEWTPLIRRCALAERSSLLGAIEVALRGSTQVTSLDAVLASWIDAASVAYSRGVEANLPDRRIATARFHFAYAIETQGDPLKLSDLSGVLRRVAHELDQQVHTGWGMFHVFDGPIGPRFKTDPRLDEGDLEFLEMNLLEQDSKVGMTDLWRVTATGLASLQRGYIEDTHWWKDIPPGQVFSPNQMAMSVTELVRHASLFAREFGEATQVHFRCEWRGLQGRRLHDFHHPWMFSGHPAAEDARRARASATVGALEASWADVAAELAGPVARAFGIGHLMTPAWFVGQSAAWLPR